MIGIYKITNPDGKVYIGKSKNIQKRFEQHKLRPVNKFLKESILTFGVENHIFEVIEECDVNSLTEKERFYINLYDDKGIVLNENTVNHVQYKRNVPIELVEELDRQLEFLKKEQSESKLT